MADVNCPLEHHHDPDRPRLAADGAYLCPGHCAALARNITDLPDLYDDLALRLAATGTAAEPVGGTRDPGLRINEHVADIRDRIRGALASWCRTVVEERGINPPGHWGPEALPIRFIGPPRLVWIPDDTPAMTAAWLARHADWLTAQQDVAHVIATEIAELRARAWSLAYPSGRRRFDIGPCPHDDCDGQLWATITQVDDLLPSLIACSDDPEHQWPADQWIAVGRKIRGRSA